jgi:hypothetical protein
MSRIFLGCPLYGWSVDWGMARAAHVLGSRQHQVDVCPSSVSLIPSNCNRLLASALNTRQQRGYEWFAMLHSDIEPAAYWLDTLIAEAEKHGADLMSAVVPIKDQRGLLSTVIADPSSLYGGFTTLTLRQVHHASFPATFGIAEAASALEQLPEELRVAEVPRSTLLVNTGCMVYRLAHWRPGIKFEQLDEIMEVGPGLYDAVWQSEDFQFSRLVAVHGGKVMATRLVSVVHHGNAEFRSGEAWGQPRK